MNSIIDSYCYYNLLDHKIIYKNRTIIYMHREFIHRDDDLPAIIHRNGTLVWYNYGSIHRDIRLGPAVINHDGTMEYWDHGKLIRKCSDKFC